MLTAGGLLLLCLLHIVNSQVGQITPLTDDYIAKIIDLHNQARKNYGLDGISWNKDLQTASEKYGSGCVFAHSGAANVGENLAIYGSSSPPAFPALMQSLRDQIEGWYDEYPDWTCNSGACASGAQCGHLTQLVSKRTTSVGCGVIRCPTGQPFDFPSQFMVCQYSPAGNMNLAKNHPCTDLPYPWAGCPASNPKLVDVVAPVPPPPATPKPPAPTPSSGPPPSTNPPPSSGPPPSSTMPSPSTNPPPTIPPPSTKPSPSIPPPSKPPPTTTPAPQPGGKIPCNADYWPNGKQVITPCKGPSTLFSVKDSKTGKTSKKPYCDCGAPDGYFWPVLNPTVCNYPAAIVNDDASNNNGALPLGAWIGIGVAAFALIVIVIAIVIIVKKNQVPTDERV